MVDTRTVIGVKARAVWLWRFPVAPCSHRNIRLFVPERSLLAGREFAVPRHGNFTAPLCNYL